MKITNVKVKEVWNFNTVEITADLDEGDDPIKKGKELRKIAYDIVHEDFLSTEAENLHKELLRKKEIKMDEMMEFVEKARFKLILELIKSDKIEWDVNKKVWVVKR